MRLDNKLQSEKIILSAVATRSAYLVFGLIFGSLTIFSFIIDFGPGHFSGISFITLGILIAFLIWLKAFKVYITSGTLYYRSLFSGIRSIPIAEIDRIEIKTAALQSFGPFMQLIIVPAPQSLQKEIIINMKIFSRQDIRDLRRALEK